MRSYTIDLAADASRSMPLATVSAAPTHPPPRAPAATPGPEETESAAPEAATTPPAAATPAAAQEAEAPPKPKPAATEAPGGWYVQLGSFSRRDNAERLSRELTGKGYAVHISPTRGGSRELFRVRVGGTASREEAAALAARLRASGYQGALVPPS